MLCFDGAQQLFRHDEGEEGEGGGGGGAVVKYQQVCCVQTGKISLVLNSFKDLAFPLDFQPTLLLLLYLFFIHLNYGPSLSSSAHTGPVYMTYLALFFQAKNPTLLTQKNLLAPFVTSQG